MQWLYVRHYGGKLVLRIEDTDRQRFVSDAEAKIYEALNWYGLNFDESPMQGGEYGPYKQSERLPLYKKYAEQLLETGNAYYCFCSTEDLVTMRQAQEAKHEAPRYDGRCRALAANIAAERATHEPHVVRIKFPQTGVSTFTDLIRGEVTFRNDLIDDQVLIKSDGWPTYHLAVVVDDHLMDISIVIRGEEWMSSTPKHLVLYNMFGWEPPKFAHLPLILGTDRSKLSKRHGSTDALQFRDEGYLSEAMVNFLSLLGWNPKTEQEFFTRDELIDKFDFTGVNKSGAIFDQKKLDWFNAQYLKKMSGDELLERARLFIQQAGLWPSGEGVNTADLSRYIEATRERFITLKDVPEAIRSFVMLSNYETNLLHWPKGESADTKSRLNRLISFLEEYLEKNHSITDIELALKNLIANEKLGMGNTLWPLRVALTGLKEGPSPFAAIYALGRDETLRRLQVAVGRLT